MKYILNKIVILLDRLESKMAFYPSVLAVGGLVTALAMIEYGNELLSGEIAEKIPPLAIETEDAVIPILTVLISGLISMMVFSFSMVMILLNQAASNYSPRLLPGLISDKKHQIVLGIYLFSILFSIFILFSFKPEQSREQIAGFVFSIIFTIIGLCSFIYFIHNISQSIQIDTILKKIFRTSKSTLEDIIEDQPESLPEFPSSEGWYEYFPTTSGYLQNISFTNLSKICEEEKTQLHILPVQGIFVLENFPIFKSSKKLEEATARKILSNFDFSKGELVIDNYALAFKQITEVIVKAMSPAVNDPGTALNGIDYLTELFALRMQKNDYIIISHKETPCVKMNSLHFDEILYNVMASIRAYCKHDIVVVQKLLLMFGYLKSRPAVNQHYYATIKTEAESLLQDAQESMANKRDIEKAFELAKSFGFIYTTDKD